LSPAKNHVIPESLASRIRLYLLDHPGAYSASQLADALAPPRNRADDRQWWSRTIAAECGRMSRKGLLVRERTSKASMGPGVLYALPARTEE
jgi:hypothetical protein